MKFSKWFPNTETPVRAGRYECELVSGAKAMLEWDGMWAVNLNNIKWWRGIVK